MIANPTGLLKKISEVCKVFLHEQGGYDNGYDTYIEAQFGKNSHETLSWKTPSSYYDVLTVKEIKKIGSNFYNFISEIIKVHGGLEEGEVIKIYYTHVEYGCFRTKVSFAKEPIVVSIIN